MKSNRLFCSKPFTWFEVSRGKREGEVFACCPSWLDTPIGNLNDQSVSDIWNGDKVQDIRRSILDGSFKYCCRSGCPHLQSRYGGGPVQWIDDISEPDFLEIVRRHMTVLPYGPREINCSYDRSCNLSCPTCRTERIIEHDRRAEILEIQRKINDEALGEARLLYITGSGDPIGSPYFRKWLRTMKRSRMPILETIRLHTNAQLWTRKAWEAIPEEIRQLIKSADISIDAAYPGTYEVNRRGGKFDILFRNLDFIATLRLKGPIEWLGINMVIQENNFQEMPDFILLGKQFRVDTVYFQQIVNWGTFSDQEFARRAIHFPDHPRHREFLDLLQEKIFEDPICHLGNLTHLRSILTNPSFVR